MLPTDDDAGRGQLLVIIGLVLGLSFVVLALVLNAAIFTENFATREATDSEQSAAYTSGIEAAIDSTYDQTNDNATRKVVHARGMFDDSLQTWADSQADAVAKRGGVFESEWTTHAGWRLEQDANGSFAPGDDADATDWTVAPDARNVSAFELNVTRSDLYDGTTGLTSIEDDAFQISVSDGATEWTLYVFRDTGNATIVVYDGDPSSNGDLGDLLDSPESCSRATTRADIDLRNHSFDGTACDALEIPGTIDGPVEIRYENVQSSTGTERVNGTYTLVVNGSSAIATNGSAYPDRFNVSDKEPPTATAIVYAVDYDTYYERDDVVHDTGGRYAPRAEAR